MRCAVPRASQFGTVMLPTTSLIGILWVRFELFPIFDFALLALHSWSLVLPVLQLAALLFLLTRCKEGSWPCPRIHHQDLTG
jgi:hypothetical protein